MKNKMIALVAVMMMLAGSAFAAVDTADVDLYVTPSGVTAVLTAAPTWYNFGTVALQASSAPANAIFTLTNAGTGGVDVTKQITSQFTGWTAIDGDPSAQTDEYRLYLGTSATASPSFVADCIATTGKTALKGAGGGTVSLAPTDGSVNIHAKLDMPEFTTTATQKKAVIQFEATTN